MRTYTSFIILIVLLSSCTPNKITGDLTIWSKLSIDFTGPNSTELGNPNPFTDYRLDVSFTSPDGEVFIVPGFYAATANPAETSDSAGNIWRVNFCPGELGKWTYKASFVKGDYIAASIEGGESAGYFDGATGSFNITEGEYSALDYKSQGKLEYVGEHYMRFRGSKNYYLKGGANSPEVLLEYAEFDNTPSERTYAEHIDDWNTGNPVWKGEKGKGIIGVMNYLSSLKMNAYYFLSMNAYGDGKKAWPWVHQDSIFRYDCSKLAQWDILFQYMNEKGILVDMVLTETENEAFFEEMELGSPEGFANSRKIYFREMVARFGYLNAISYNIGEENGWHDKRKFQQGNSDEQRKLFADYLRNLTYYNDFIGVHNGPSWDKHIYKALYGHKSFSGPSFQWDFGKGIYNEILTQRINSGLANHKWVVNFDEPYVDPQMRDVNEWRKYNVWAAYMAGGAGVELYIGNGLDVHEQNLRPYELHFNTIAIAKDFFQKYIPFYEMEPDTSFCNTAWTLRKKNELFVLYSSTSSEMIISLSPGDYEIKWFDPVKGGEIINGNSISVSGNKSLTLTSPFENTEQDYVCILEKQ